MNFNSPASLGFYASVKIAATLYCHLDLVELERKQFRLVGWVKVQDKVTQLVQCLQLPKNIEENVQELIQPVGDQIRSWLSKRTFVVRNEVDFGKYKLDLYDKFSWTSHGMIDYKRTAETLIKSGQLDRRSRFSLACLDATDNAADYIKIVTDISEIFQLGKSVTAFRCGEECHLMMDHVAGSLFYEPAIRRTASNGNTSLTRCFMKKIEPHRKAYVLGHLVLSILKSNNRFLNLDTLLFLLSEMEISQMNELFNQNAEIVLLRFLEWPLQRHFTELANKLWGSISPASFNSILQAIAQHIIQHCSISTNPFGYKDIFKDFWLKSPPEYRRACLSELIVPILSSLFRSHGYYHSVLKLFEDESCNEKLEALFFNIPEAILEILSNENKAKAFESIIRRYFPPNDIPHDFAEKYTVFTQKYLESYYGENDIAD